MLAIVLSEVFEDAGYRVHVATNVDDAVELLSRVDIDLLVADEKQDCGALVVWAREYAPRAKIIVASDNASAKDMPITHEFGACIAKALMPECLLTIAEGLLQPGTAANDYRELADGRKTTGWPRKNAL